MNRIGKTDLDVFPLCLGGNVFGWTADEATVVRRARRLRGRRRQLHRHRRRLLAVGARQRRRRVGDDHRPLDGRARQPRRHGHRDQGRQDRRPQGLSAATIRAAAEDSLRRLGTDRIDLYYAHDDDPATPLEETLARVRRAGPGGQGALRRGVQLHGARGSPRRCERRRRDGLAALRGAPAALQPRRTATSTRARSRPLCRARGLACVPYYALAERLPDRQVPARRRRRSESARAADAAAYLDERGLAVLARSTRSPRRTSAPVAAVALAWLAAQPTASPRRSPAPGRRAARGAAAGGGPEALAGGAGAAGCLVGAGKPVPAGAVTARGPPITWCRGRIAGRAAGRAGAAAQGLRGTAPASTTRSTRPGGREARAPRRAGAA